MIFITEQTFETLGDPSRTEHTSLVAARKAANALRRDIAEMVSGWETPARRESATGSSAEIHAWSTALEIAGVEFDDAGERTPESPVTYGPIAGGYIAQKSIVIRTI